MAQGRRRGEPELDRRAGAYRIPGELRRERQRLHDARDGPAEPAYLFFLGTSAAQVPFGDGWRCVQDDLTRVWPPATAVGGVAERQLDTAFYGITMGAIVHMQCWYRDPAAGLSGFNLSDALQVTFE